MENRKNIDVQKEHLSKAKNQKIFPAEKYDYGSGNMKNTKTPKIINSKNI